MVYLSSALGLILVRLRKCLFFDAINLMNAIPPAPFINQMQLEPGMGLKIRLDCTRETPTALARQTGMKRVGWVELLAQLAPWFFSSLFPFPLCFFMLVV